MKMNLQHISVLVVSALLMCACEQSDPPGIPDAPDFGREGNVVSFSGYDWDVKHSEFVQGPGPNFFSEHPDDIWIDGDGHLHMTITQRDGVWYATELVSQENMGYGKYKFVIEGDFVSIPENIVVGLFTWDNNTFFEQANSEIDIELAKWGDTDKENTLQYAVQPVAFGDFFEERVDNPPSTEEYLVGISTHTFEWSETLVSFKSYEGNSENPTDLISSWEFDLNNPPRVKQEGGQSSNPIIIPAPGATTNARINFWILPWISAGPTDGLRQEFVVRNFDYVPA